MRKFKTILVTGGAGFIGSNFIRYVFEQTDFCGTLINVDSLTYAGKRENLADIETHYASNGRYVFIMQDIGNYSEMENIITTYVVDAIVHFAAETHVDRSIFGPSEFIHTNIIGTFTLLEIIRKRNENGYPIHFHHISTDEVYGSLGAEGYFSETSPYDPRSPYSASKASSDHLVKAYYHTYGIPITLSNCSNNYGPYQYPEKFIPLMITNMVQGKQLPIYGDGKNIRDWVFVDDHNAAVWTILSKGQCGDTYAIGGGNEWENIELVKYICEITAQLTGKPVAEYLSLITYVSDRSGHDRRYAIDCTKLKRDLGWKPCVDFADGIALTVRWYCKNLKQVAEQ